MMTLRSLVRESSLCLVINDKKHASVVRAVGANAIIVLSQSRILESRLIQKFKSIKIWFDIRVSEEKVL